MTIIDTITKRKPGRQPLPSIEAPAIAGKLAEAMTALDAAEARYSNLSFDFARGEIDQGPVDDAARELASVRHLVDTLARAHEVALVHDREAKEVNKRHLQAQQLRNLEKILAERDAAAVALTAALEEAAKQYRVLIERSERAVMAAPVGAEFPRNGGFQSINRLVGEEIFRISGSPDGKHKFMLPAAHTDIVHKFNPQGVTPLVDVITKTSADALKRLTDFVKSGE